MRVRIGVMVVSNGWSGRRLMDVLNHIFVPCSLLSRGCAPTFNVSAKPPSAG